MGWRSVVIANPSVLCLEDRALTIKQNGSAARVMLEDISVLVLDHPSISLTVPLLSACADRKIAVITVNTSHLPNGILLPYLPHSRALKVIQAQLNMTRPDKKKLWQRIVQFKIRNQAALLISCNKIDSGSRLKQLALNVRSGDPDNYEAQAAQLYFRGIFDKKFNRSQLRFYNAAINYCYAVIRGAIARTLVGYGFVTAFGLFHHSEQNNFNLADDLFEPYRPIVDASVINHYPEEPDRDLEPADKGRLVAILHTDVTLSSHNTKNANGGRCTMLAAIEATISGLSSIILNGAVHDRLVLPQINMCKFKENSSDKL
jgi:CRISP-associated protein Cas1